MPGLVACKMIHMLRSIDHRLNVTLASDEAEHKSFEYFKTSLEKSESFAACTFLIGLKCLALNELKSYVKKNIPDTKNSNLSSLRALSLFQNCVAFVVKDISDKFEACKQQAYALGRPWTNKQISQNLETSASMWIQSSSPENSHVWLPRVVLYCALAEQIIKMPQTKPSVPARVDNPPKRKPAKPRKKPTYDHDISDSDSGGSSDNRGYCAMDDDDFEIQFTENGQKEFR